MQGSWAGGQRVSIHRQDVGEGLAPMFCLCSHSEAMRIDPAPSLHAAANAILHAPGWARVGITAPTETLRHQAALELARVVLEGGPKEGPNQAPGDDQLSLPM